MNEAQTKYCLANFPNARVKESAIDNDNMAHLLTNPNNESFISSLRDFLRRTGYLTIRQCTALDDNYKRYQAKLSAALNDVVESEKKQYPNILTAFALAKESKEKPAFYAYGLYLNMMGKSSRYAGSISVCRVDDDSYMGSIKADGVYRITDIATIEALDAIELNPSEAAIAYGKATGICSCCGRKLTNPDSVAAGIGPICRDNWGFAA